jgi:hypothetical protein
MEVINWDSLATRRLIAFVGALRGCSDHASGTMRDNPPFEIAMSGEICQLP